MSERFDPKQNAKTEGARAKPGATNPYKGVLALWWEAGRQGAVHAARTPPVQPFVLRDGKVIPTFIPWRSA